MRFSSDHPCAYCGVPVYHRIEDMPGVRGFPSERVTVYEVARAVTHTCAMRSAPRSPFPEITMVRCPDCRLHVYQQEGLLYDDETALGPHFCELVAPEPQPASPPPPSWRPAARGVSAPPAEHAPMPMTGLSIPTL